MKILQKIKLWILERRIRKLYKGKTVVIKERKKDLKLLDIYVLVDIDNTNWYD